MLNDLSDMTATEVVTAVNDMIHDGEFPVLCGTMVRLCGGMGTILPEAGFPLIRGQAIATVSVSRYFGQCAHGCPACPHPVNGQFVVGSMRNFVRGLPIVTMNSIGVHAACCGPNQGFPLEAVYAPIHVEDVMAMH